jgi:hypothetical protein
LLLPPNAAVFNFGRAETTASCPQGTTVVGGGAVFPPGTSTIGNAVELLQSAPHGNGWLVRADNQQATNRQLSVTALCLKNKLKLKGK